jgi:hypothetical protein
VSLLSHITPSDRAGELLLIVRRLRKHTGEDVVPVLVVEGAADEEVFGELCVHGTRQVFAAGNRDLVEQLLRHIRSSPIDGCECLYLVDCDGYGKTPDLSAAAELVVSETCDLESDLVQLGAAERLAERFISTGAAAKDLVDRACALALPLSIVRRASFLSSVSMRRPKHQLRMADFSDLQLSAWDGRTPTEQEMLGSVASELEWSTPTRERVKHALPQVSRDFDRTTLGKDAIDALYWLLKREGQGEVRGWNLSFFYKSVARELHLDDLDGWEVGRRLRAWEAASGHKLMKPST